MTVSDFTAFLAVWQRVPPLLQTRKTPSMESHRTGYAGNWKDSHYFLYLKSSLVG